VSGQHRPDAHSDGAARDPREVLTRPARPPDLVISYGTGADQVADVHLPPGRAGRGAAGGGTSPLALFLHGGFWRAEYGREHTAPLAEALAEAGFVVAAPEFRRIGQPGGGWPGTFDDVAKAVDRLPGLVARTTGGLADPGRVVVAGHSAGGHLALWAAGRRRVSPATPWYRSRGPMSAVVVLAAVTDLESCFDQALGNQAADALMGGGPAEVDDRYRNADPMRLLAHGVPVRLVHGTDDDRVPAQMSVDYADRASEAGDPATCVLVPGAGHFEVIDPLSSAWSQVLAAFTWAAEQAAG
jgi:acetyl esterase/lipase